MAYILYLYLIKNESEGDIFPYHDFVTSIVLIAEISQRKISNLELNDLGKVVKILERVEISPGFEKVSKKIIYETAITPSILRAFL